MQALKAIKTVAKGIPTKAKRKITVSQDTVTYCDMDQSLYISRIPSYSESLREFDSIAEFELAGIPEVDCETIGKPEGALPLTKYDIDSMAWVALATDTESTRYLLGGVLLTGNEVVGTDGRRMHVATIGTEFPESTTTIIPVRAVTALVELCKLTKESVVYVTVNRDSVTFWGQYWKFNTRLIDGRFPNYKQVIPHSDGKEKRYEITSESVLAECADTIKRVALENKVALAKCTKSERKSFVEKTPLLERYTMQFDCRYIVDAIGKARYFDMVYEPELRNRINSPAIIRAGNHMSVIMPCKV